MRTIIIKNNAPQDYDITDLFNFNITASGVVTISDYFSEKEISGSNFLIEKIAEAVFTVNNGEEDLNPSDGVKYCIGEKAEVRICSEYRDRSGKLRVHQTSRKLGTMI